jgi:glucosamine 6-phosphate synthetase-like amidotransferase/phosphosugar isomerase protein
VQHRCRCAASRAALRACCLYTLSLILQCQTQQRARRGCDEAADGCSGTAPAQMARRIIFCACGTSWHAALVGEYMIESLCRIPVEVICPRSSGMTRAHLPGPSAAGRVSVSGLMMCFGTHRQVEYASEFRYRSVVLRPEEDIVIVISQASPEAGPSHTRQLRAPRPLRPYWRE